MFKVAPILATAAVASSVAIAAPAHANTAADQFVRDLIQQKQLSATDKVWLAPPALDRTARDVAICDAVSAALTAQGIAVMWDVGLAPALTVGGFQEQFAVLKNMGATKLMSFSRADDLGNLTVRIAEVPGGWIKSVRTVQLGQLGMAAAPRAIVSPSDPVGPTVIIPADRLVNWNPNHGVGLQYSSLSGSGAAYRYWSGGWGLQVAGIPALAFNNNQTSGFVNLGFQAMSTVLKTDHLRLYTLLGVGSLYRPSEIRSTYDPNTSNYSSRTGEAWDIGIAPGIALDYRFYDRFLLTGALGYTFSRQSFMADTPSYAYSPGLTLGTVIEW